MASVKWIKLNVDMFDDEKIKIIQSMPEGDAILLVWIKLILLAGKTNEGGYIYISENMPYTEEMLSVVINKPLNIIRLAIETFTRLGMIENDEKGIYLVNFEKHQSLDKLEQIREQTRLRVAKHRAKLKENNDVTLQVTQSNAIDKDIDKEIDIDIENKKENIKEKKNKYGFYKHVLLTPSEYQKLQDEYNNYEELITFLDEYIEMKGYKAKNHYLCIKKWVVDAVKEKNIKRKEAKQFDRPVWLDMDL
jgi:predicted phage replisome organizer